MDIPCSRDCKEEMKYWIWIFETKAPEQDFLVRFCKVLTTVIFWKSCRALCFKWHAAWQRMIQLTQAIACLQGVEKKKKTLQHHIVVNIFKACSTLKHVGQIRVLGTLHIPFIPLFFWWNSLTSGVSKVAFSVQCGSC